jgi:hypothetical protein
MATTAPAQMNLAGGEPNSQSAWHHAVATYGGIGQQHAGPNGVIAMTGGRRRQSKRQRGQSKRQRRQSRSRKVDRRQSKKQRGGRR